MVVIGAVSDSTLIIQQLGPCHADDTAVKVFCQPLRLHLCRGFILPTISAPNECDSIRQDVTMSNLNYQALACIGRGNISPRMKD